ncbi:MAG: Ribosomal-protein-S18p-alanine acetyltransferase, partial [uncultured Acidimicrobiales bacterium]
EDRPGARSRRRSAGGAPGADAPEASPVGAEDRGAGLRPPVVTEPLPLRAHPPRQPLLLRRSRRGLGRRLCRPHAERRGRARDQHRRRPGLAPPQDRHAAPRQPRPGGPATKGAQPHPRGAREQRGGQDHVHPVRLRAGGNPQELLHRDERGRVDHVGRAHRHPGVRSPARPSRSDGAGAHGRGRDPRM